MVYKIVVTAIAEESLDKIINYLIYEKRNPQAARNVLDDFENTKNNLTRMAGSLHLCENPKLKELGYRRINFLSHRYFVLYRIIDNVVFIDNIFHSLQDFEHHLV